MFRIESLNVYNHKILKSFELDFSNEDNISDNSDVFITTIIGTNGIGKSYVLRVLAEVVDFIASHKPDIQDVKLITDYNFEIKYFVDGHHCVVRNFIDDNLRDGFLLMRLSSTVDGRDERLVNMPKPRRIVASTMTVNDKFTAKSTDVYRYQGIRQEAHPNATGTKTIVRKTVKGIINSLRYKENFKEELEELLRNIGLQPRLELRYNMRYKEVFFSHATTPEGLKNVFHNWKQFFGERNSPIWGARYFETIENNQNALETICKFIRKISINGFSRSPYVVRYMLPQETYELGQDANALEYLSKLDLLSYPDLKTYKDQSYDFIDSSSGETQLLCQLLGIMSEIRNDSLVLIDEPESSLHPNWQMNYIDWLREVFARYSDCHFVIATHSHFLLTNLAPENSSIMALDRINGRLLNVAKGANAFCWSTDEILYRIFHVRTTRNWAFEDDMRKLYQKVTHKQTDDEEYRKLLERLSGYVLSDNDPLNNLLSFAKGNAKFE